MKLMLRQRMYLQFSLALLPLVISLLVQLTVTSDLPAKINRILGWLDLVSQASDQHKQFMDGINDAVDTGKVGQKAMTNLSTAREKVQVLVHDHPSADVKTAADALDKIQATLNRNNSVQSLVALRGDVKATDTALAAAFTEIKDLAARTVADEDQYAQRKAWIEGGIALSTLLLLAVIVRQLVLGVTRPLASAVQTAQQVSHGDLSGHIQVQREDEIGALQQALKEMRDALHGIVADVRSGTDMITNTSEQISVGNADLSARTQQQGAALEQTVATMKNLTEAVQNNAQNASQANHLASQASDIAQRGGAVVSTVVDTMGSIQASASKIVDIIAVIDGIAFQTNILALNAAVEAARAGEQGRGFAVVASEVRTLAQRSAKAAHEIKDLIGDSMSRVTTGATQVQQAGSTMQEIVDSIKMVTALMSDITTASEQQANGIRQVNQAINQIEQSTQQNASLVEQASAATGSLHDQAMRLAKVVHTFRLQGRA